MDPVDKKNGKEKTKEGYRKQEKILVLNGKTQRRYGEEKEVKLDMKKKKGDGGGGGEHIFVQEWKQDKLLNAVKSCECQVMHTTILHDLTQHTLARHCSCQHTLHTCAVRWHYPYCTHMFRWYDKPRFLGIKAVIPYMSCCAINDNLRIAGWLLFIPNYKSCQDSSNNSHVRDVPGWNLGSLHWDKHNTGTHSLLPILFTPPCCISLILCDVIYPV